MKVPKETIGLAGEFATASELCRRGIYAQLTLGYRKRTDLLVETEHAMLRIQVKAKQGSQWPNVKGIYGDDIILICVDYQGKADNERPDFYILTEKDWVDYINLRKKEMEEKGRKMEINEHNVPIWPEQVNKYGQPYTGCGIESKYIQQHRERWDKIKKLLQEQT